MKFKLLTLFTITLALNVFAFTQTKDNQDNTYLSWTPKYVKSVGKLMRKRGKVGSSFSVRGIKTSRAINYKLRATMMSPEMIRATARFQQFRNRLSNTQTKKLVEEADSINGLVFMIELDPNEGSGVIPLDWRVFIQPKGLKLGDEGAIKGKKESKLRKVKALTGVFKRDYDYDRFFVFFPLIDEDKKKLIADNVNEIELIVGIGSQEEKLTWRLPSSVIKKINLLSQTN